MRRVTVEDIARLRALAGRLRAALPALPAAGRAVGITGALLWRCGAAATGIACAAALVTAVSGALAPTPAVATTDPAGEARPPRDAARTAAAAGGHPGEWRRLIRPIAPYHLESPELDRQTPAHEAWRSAEGASRRDRLTAGAFGEDRPHLTLLVQRDRAGAPAGPPFTVAIVREAGAQGLALTRATRATGLETKFGTVETADVELAGADRGRACIAFRHREAEVGFAHIGFWCGTTARPADRRQLACLIDRLDLVAAAADPELRGLFARAELKRRPGCAPPALAAAGRKPNWLDREAAAPPLKQRVTAVRSAPRAEPPALRR